MCENHDYCYVEMSEKNKILKYNYGEKSIKVPFIIYVDIESLLESMNTSHNNPEKSSTTKISTQLPVIHCSHTVHLIKQKISLIIIEVKIA